jgi:predicted nucleic acid-binding protein
MIFLDTNVFVYAFSADPKHAAAREIIADGGLISAQALNEFTSSCEAKRGAPRRI